jgi:hypothetical protein
VQSQGVQTTGEISAIATDPGSGESSTAATHTWTDTNTTTPPALPTVNTPSVDASSSDLVVSGTAEPGSMVTVTFPDGSTGSALADANTGDYSVTSSAMQTGGEISVTATDAAGNASEAASATYTPTAVSAVVPPEPSGLEVAQNTNGTLTVTGTANSGDTVTVTFADNSSVTGTADASGHFSVQSQGVQTTGEISAIATDPGSGESSTAATQPWTDTTPPGSPTVSTPSVDASSGDLVVSGTAEPGSTVKVIFPDGSTDSALADASTGDYSVTSSAVQTGGEISVTATDAAGNTSEAASASYTVEPAPGSGPTSGEPAQTVSLTSIDDASPASTAAVWYINSDNVTFHGALVGGALSGSEQVQISWDGGNTWQAVPDANVTGTTWSYTTPLPTDGSYSVEVRVFDSSTGQGGVSSTPQQVYVDTVPPTENVTVNGGGDGSSANPISGTVSGALADGTGTASPEHLQINLGDGGGWQDVTVAPGSMAWSYVSSTPLDDGAYTVQAQVVDAAGNLGPLASYTVDIGGVAPNVSISTINPDLGTSSYDWITSSSSLTFSGTLSSPLTEGATVQITLENGSGTEASGQAKVTTDEATGITSWSFDNTANTLSDGFYTISAVVKDGAGNTLLNGSPSQPVIISHNGTLPLSLSDVLQYEGATQNGQQAMINNGGIVSTVQLAGGVAGVDPGGQWQETSTTTVNGVLYNVYHNTSEGASTAADLLIQQGITVI